MEYKNIIVDIDGGVARVRLNRPKVLNALNGEVFEELKDLFISINKDRSIRVLVISGEGGRAFAAGADILGMKDQTQITVRPMVETSMRALHLLETMPTVSIAAVNGYALGGGCELAMACDMRIAADDAKFGLPETGLGIIPGSGGTQRLSRLIGAAKAKELIFTGDTISADEAERIGLVNKVVPAEKLNEETEKIVKKILKKGPIAIRAAKEAIYAGCQMDIESGLRNEMNIFVPLFATEDQKEGMTAFAEKRPPVYKDK